MTSTRAFDPYQVLGVGVDADEVVVQLAYRARIRAVHPDVAGSAGLEQTKRLNAARDWLLDPNRRAQLRGPWARPPGTYARPDTTGARRGSPPPGWHGRSRQRPASEATDHAATLDPLRFDFGPHTDELRSFFSSIQALSRDERARVNYSLGEARPVFFGAYEDYLGPQLWSRSRALRDAVSAVWQTGLDEAAPFVSPLGQVLPHGFLVTNAYAQWILQRDFLRRELRDGVFRSEHFIDTFAARCTDPWEASIRQARYGPNQERVIAFLHTAGSFSVGAAERLARSWQRHLGQAGVGDAAERIGPGVWLPAPPDYPEVLKVSGYLAAVDASRIEPPAGLDDADHDSYRAGLRLTGHVLALGLDRGSGHDYLRPWREATSVDRSLWRRLRLQPTDR